MSTERLPIVSKAVVDAFYGTVIDTPDFEKATWERLQVEQPVLTQAVDEFMHSVAHTGKDLEIMAYVYMLTYSLLKSQVDVQGMSDMSIPESREP